MISATIAAALPATLTCNNNNSNVNYNMIKATKMLKKPSTTDLYKTKLKMKSNEKQSDLQNAGEVIVSTGSVSVGAGTTAAAMLDQQPLKKFSLRGNQLSGSILIGNYNYLTQLEVSENEMEVLDLSSLAQLETLKCSHNKLLELMINGSNLTSLVADFNCLHLINISPVPSKLYHADISHNYFTELPKWLNECEHLETLNASHNQLQKVTDFLLTSKTTKIRDLNLSYNSLRIIERLPERFGQLEKLQLQSNELQLLTDNLFAITKGSLKLLNLSCNRLQILPPIEEKEDGFVLERLMVTSNNLDDRMFEVLKQAKKLRVLYAAYNKISTITEESLRHLDNLEELMLSGNLLQQLPDSICDLKRLQVLRVHSNLLLFTPGLSKLALLKVLDLAHNHLDHLDLMSLVPKNLKYLDLSCNLQLQVDEHQVKMCRSQRKWSLVDVSGKNRINLPTKKSQEAKESVASINHTHKPPWLLGFSETTGRCRKLFVIQLRECKFRTDEALFGMFVSAPTHSGAASRMAQLVPKLLQQERTVKENIGDYMKYTLLGAQQKLSDQPVVSSMLCHIARENTRVKDLVRPHKTRRYVLRIAGVGDLGAYLIRRTTNVQLIARPTHLKSSTLSPNLSDPSVAEWVLGNDDEYLVICNQGIWSVLDVDRIAREIRKEENVVLAAKRLQDMAQSFGSEDNLSVIVIRFRNIGTDVDHLIKELKQTVRRKPQTLTPSTVSTAIMPNVCKRACCDRNLNCRHRFGSARQLAALAARGSDRSSPSGQSDQALSIISPKPDPDNEYILAHARVLEETTEMEMLDETDSVLSEEQFKCWEYMLEQNTQLLFDKELNTISKSFTKNRNAERKSINRSTPERYDYKSNLLKNSTPKFISSSSPQLLYSEVKKPSVALNNSNNHQAVSSTTQQQQVSFLSKHFGSSRSFGAGYSIFSDGNTKSRDSLASGNGYSKLSGGPNAAYFGSLQRLMPYNLEYDFAVTQERSFLDEEDDDFTEHENRMRKYWGVATTEL